MMKRLLQNKTIQNIFKLISGAMLSQIILLASMPLLTRLYTPAEFGLYSLFLSVIAILSIIASLRYDQAIVLPKHDKDAKALVQLSIILIAIICLIIIIFEIIFYSIIIDYFDSIFYLIAIPIGTFLMASFNVLNAYCARNQFFATMSVAKVSNSITLMSIQIASKIGELTHGLLAGKIIADIATISILLKKHFQEKTLQYEKIDKELIANNAKEYDNFPKFQAATSFINAISQNIPIIMLATLFDKESAGFYGLTIRVLQAPITLVGQSIREVYYQKAANLYSNGKSFFQIYKKTTTALFGIFLIPFIILQLYSNELFLIVFGEKWETSGTYAKILVFWYFAGFINTPTITSFNILGKQKFQLKLEAISLILRFLALYAGYAIFESTLYSIGLFSISGIITNLIALIFIIKVLKSMNNSYQ